MVVVALVAVWGIFLAHGVVKARHGQRFTVLLSHTAAIGALALVFKTASDSLITYPWPGWLVVALIAAAADRVVVWFASLIWPHCHKCGTRMSWHDRYNEKEEEVESWLVCPKCGQIER